MKKIIKKSFVVCLALIMAALTLIPAFAEDEPIKLSESNIVEYPTVLGEIYYSQKLSDHLSLVGGKVTADGTAEGEEIPGYFDFLNSDDTAVATDPNIPQYTSIKFIPENEDLYTGIEIKDSSNVKIYVKNAGMKLADSASLITATVPAAGMPLMLATVNKIDVKSELTDEVISGVTWSWKLLTEKVTKSSFYLATISKLGYKTIEVYVYVRIPGDISEPIVSEFPTIEPVTYHDGLKAGELNLIGGDTDGTFTVSNPEQELTAGSNAVDVTFAPSDGSENVTVTIFVDVKKAEASFIDENGELIVPVLNWNIGSRYAFSNLRNTLEYYYPANCGTFKIGSFTKMLPLDESRNYYDTSTPGTYDCVASLKSQANTNYTNTLKFKIKVDKKVVTPRITRYINTDELIIDGLDYTDKLGGTFKVYANGELIKSTENGVKYLTRFDWRPAKSGTYKLKAEYTPADDDICVITGNVIENEVTVALKWTVKGENVNFASTTAQYGTNVTVLQSLGDNFNGWEFYDENGNKYANPEKELNMRYDPTVPSTVNFTMPDHDVTVKALDKTQINLPGGDGNFSDFLAGLKQWFTNLFAKLKALLQAVEQLLSVVG